MGFSEGCIESQEGHIILITGANSGIGFSAAKMLAGQGAKVLFACRSEAKARAAMAQLRDYYDGDVDLGFVPLDLADPASIRAAVEQVERLDVLINNAGIMNPPLRLTDLGVESQFATNHLGHFALTSLLLPKIDGPDPRVVSVASLAHRRAAIDFDNFDGSRGYRAMQFYGQSKLANMLFFAELDRRLRAIGSPIKAMGCHPGLAGTGLGNGVLENMVFKLAGVFFNTADAGALPTLQAATDPEAQGGDYYGPQGFGETRGASGKASRTAQAADPQLAARLWNVSVELTGVDPGLVPA